MQMGSDKITLWKNNGSLTPIKSSPADAEPKESVSLHVPACRVSEGEEGAGHCIY